MALDSSGRTECVPCEFALSFGHVHDGLRQPLVVGFELRIVRFEPRIFGFEQSLVLRGIRVVDGFFGFVFLLRRLFGDLGCVCSGFREFFVECHLGLFRVERFATRTEQFGKTSVDGLFSCRNRRFAFGMATFALPIFLALTIDDRATSLLFLVIPLVCRALPLLLSARVGFRLFAHLAPRVRELRFDIGQILLGRCERRRDAIGLSGFRLFVRLGFFAHDSMFLLLSISMVWNLEGSAGIEPAAIGLGNRRSIR